MRIGLYGLPTAGKSYVLSAVKNLEVLSGSSLLKRIAPNFYELSEMGKANVRRQLALKLKKKNQFIMDGHYSFGEQVVFTKEDGQLYDTFLYLYSAPEIIFKRMEKSERNRKYLKYDIERWQSFEIESLRNYCHANNKDFYIIDNSDMNIILEFIDEIVNGFSCVNFAKEVVGKIPNAEKITLLDGDKTLIKEDSSAILGYVTHLFDGNFYSGFQAWRHNSEMKKYVESLSKPTDDIKVSLNKDVFKRIEGNAVILTTGYSKIWKQIAAKYEMEVYYGAQMCADTKYFIAKFLQERGSKIIAFGDSMNDYYMLKQADTSYLVLKQDGAVSSSLTKRSLEGFRFV